jgi:hypothetical protein
MSALQKCLDEEKNNEYSHIEESIKKLEKCLLENGDINYCYNNYREELHNMHVNPMFTNSMQKLNDCLKKNMPNTFTQKPKKPEKEGVDILLIIGGVLVLLLLGYLVYNYLTNIDVDFFDPNEINMGENTNNLSWDKLRKDRRDAAREEAAINERLQVILNQNRTNYLVKQAQKRWYEKLF